MRGCWLGLNGKAVVKKRAKKRKGRGVCLGWVLLLLVHLTTGCFLYIYAKVPNTCHVSFSALDQTQNGKECGDSRHWHLLPSRLRSAGHPHFLSFLFSLSFNVFQNNRGSWARYLEPLLTRILFSVTVTQFIQDLVVRYLLFQWVGTGSNQ